MKAFEFDQGPLREFVEGVERALSDSGLSDFVRLRRDGDDLVVTFRWMGSSELRYEVEERDGGFFARLSGEKISPFHHAFRQRFEEKFEQVIGSVGARVV